MSTHWKNVARETEVEDLTHTHTQSTTEAAKCQLDTDERNERRNVGLSESLVLSRPKSTVASIFQSQTWRI